MKLTEETFIKFTQGNPGAFQAIFNCYRMRVFYFVRKLVDDTHAAEEITSDVFLKIHHRHTTFNSLNSMLAFLHVAARNAGLDYIKHRKLRAGQMALTEEVFSTADGDTPTFGETDVEAMVLQCIYEQIEQLAPRTKTIFKLTLKGLSLSQIAKEMNISTQTVANLKSTALKQLRIKVLEMPKIVWAFMMAAIFGKNE